MRASGSPSLLQRLFPNLFALPLAANPGADLHGAVLGTLASVPTTVAYGLILGSALGGAYVGLGVLVALYGSVIVGLAAVILGGCPLLVTGPRAATFLVITALIAQLHHAAVVAAAPEPAVAALALACFAVLLSGLLQVAFGLSRLGRLARFVPLPVVAGFINSSALLIILSQLWSATGVPAQPSALSFFAHLGEIKPATLLLSAATALLILLPRTSRRGLLILAVVGSGTLFYHLLGWLGWGAALGGTLPAPPDHIRHDSIIAAAMALLGGEQRDALLRLMIPASVSMAILSSLDTLLATSATDALTMRRSDGGRQLVAEGLGNVLAACFGMGPGSGSMLRTHAALQGGMVSAAAPLLIALITLVVTVALAPSIGYLPQAVMAGLLIALGVDLFDKWTLARLRGLLALNKGPLVARGDLLTVVAVVATTLVLDLASAVGVGILVAFVSFVLQMANTPVRRCYRAKALIPRIHGDLRRQLFLERYGERIAVIEMDGALFFGSAPVVEAQAAQLVDDGVRYIVLDLKRAKNIDATGARVIEQISATLTRLGGLFVVAHVDRERRADSFGLFGRSKRRGTRLRKIWLKLEYLGTTRVVGYGHFFSDLDAALSTCEQHIAATLAQEDLGTADKARRLTLRSLDRRMLIRLRAYLTRMKYAPGATIFAQDAAADGAYYVAAGGVDVVIDLPGTERKLKVQTLTAGAIFGEMALIDPKPRSASIQAREHTLCYFLSDAAFQALKREHREIAFALLSDVASVFAERLRATNNMLAEMGA